MLQRANKTIVGLPQHPTTVIETKEHFVSQPPVNETDENPVHAGPWVYALCVGLCMTFSALYSLFVDPSVATGPMFRISCYYTGVCCLLALFGFVVQSPGMKWVGIVFGSIGIGPIIASPILAWL